MTPTTSTAPPSGYTTHAMSTTWYNGFGQALQSTTRMARDIVSLNDNRVMLEKPSYLPYAAGGSGVNFQQTGFADQKSWYNTAYPQEGDNAYSRVKPEVNGSERSVTSYAPGKSLTGSDRGTTVSAEVNTTTRPIRLLKNGSVNTSCDYVRFYTPGELIVTKTVGQHEAESYEYRNRNSQLVCKQVIVDGAPLTTYYVYDDLGRITWIITPKAVEALETANWSGNLDAIFEGLCHRYAYNKYGQLVERHIPDKEGLELTVYDAKHRPVLQQTPLLKTHSQWVFQIYDSRDRIVLSGLVNSSDDRATWQSIADGSNVPPIIETNGLIDLILHECNGPQPETMTGCVINQHNYYDNYRFDPSLPFSGRAFSATPGDYINLANTVIPVPYSFVQGQLTATRTRVTSPGNPFPGEWTSTVYFYDAKGRAIQSQTQYPWNNQAWDIASTQYTFTGAVFRTILYHQALPGSLKTGITKMMVTRTYEQGQQGRLTGTALWLDGKLSNLATYSYDELGRLKEKNIGGIEKQQYRYNIRGQLTGINPDYVFTPTYPDATFGERISYDYGFTQNRYDGAIGGMIWRGAGSKATIRSYGYRYDQAGRMTAADFNKREDGLMQQGTPLWNHDKEDYSVSGISYDANGNIQSMSQQGMTNTGGGIMKVTMDELSYWYLPNSNKLESVDDAVDPTVNAAYGLNDFINRNQGRGNWDYEYDVDGNLTIDRNKGINNISYNYQDLPEEVDAGPGKHITNIYDASGALLQKTVLQNGTGKVYRYAGPFVYEDNQPSYVLHEEGRARWLPDSLEWRTDYFIKDHLGNVRTVLAKDKIGMRDYVATHEPGKIVGEKKMFDVNADPGVKPASSSPDDLTAVDLNGAVSGKQLGTSLMLKVMAGDKFKAEVSAYYDPEQAPETGEVITTEGMGTALIGALSGGITGIGSEAGVTGEMISSMFGSGEFVNSYGPLMNTSTDPSQPKAYLNYVLFDEEMKVVKELSGAIQVTSANAGQWSQLEMPDELEIPGNGFLVVFMGNLDPHWTSMDNLKVSYSRGRLLEEQHYYPHGMVANDGSNTPLKNRYLYQGKELQDEVGLQLYDFHARQYDPQIGRFWGIDPADQFPSGYTGMGNNPASGVDPDGMRVNGDVGWNAGGWGDYVHQSGEWQMGNSGEYGGSGILERLLGGGFEVSLGGGSGGVEAAQGDGDGVTVIGPGANQFVQSIQSNTSLTLTYDDESGLLTAKGSPVTEFDYLLLRATMDGGVNVNMLTTNANGYTENNKKQFPLMIGGYGGSDVNFVNGQVNAYQYYNANQSAAAEKAGISTSKADASHELAEAYLAAKAAPGDNNGFTGVAGQNAHAEAGRIVPGTQPAPLLDKKTGDVYLINPPNIVDRVFIFNRSSTLYFATPASVKAEAQIIKIITNLKFRYGFR